MDLELEENTPKTSAPTSQPTSTQIRTGKIPSTSQTSKHSKDAIAIWKVLRHLSRFGLYLGLVLYIGGTYVLGRFDKKLNIDRSVRRNPVQTSIQEAPFPFKYHDEQYVIEPIASYDISGLIVTHNDISSLFDSYHTKKSVDFRDICLVWGANVGSGIFRRYQFWSMPWSCHFKALDEAADSTLVETQLSNNHLIAADDRVRNQIMKFRIGDQIHLQGKLINYWRADSPEYRRTTSTVRDDTGNGACEVLWVESAELLQRGGSSWHIFQVTGKWLLIASIILGAIVFLLAPLNVYKRPTK